MKNFWILLGTSILIRLLAKAAEESGKNVDQALLASAVADPKRFAEKILESPETTEGIANVVADTIHKQAGGLSGALATIFGVFNIFKPCKDGTCQ